MQKKNATRASRQDGDATRQVLLDVAGQVFAERGFADATSKEICARAGTNIAAVNYHFGSRGALYEAVLVEAHHHLLKLEEMQEITSRELALLFNAERSIGADLTVVRLEGWRRDQWFDHTGLSWVNPSPNMRNLTQATLYPGIGAIEYANISVGRGTDQPFEQIGAPWIDGPRLAAALNARGLPGIRF